MIRAVVALLALTAGAPSAAREPLGLDTLLAELAGNGAFSGAVVVRDARGTRFARGYGRPIPSPADASPLIHRSTAARSPSR